MDDHDEQDRALIAAAAGLLACRYRTDRHEVGAALRTRSGRVYAAVNVDTRLRRASTCAEAVALGMAAAADDLDITAVVAVNREGRVVSPCGVCREMLADYAPQARILVPGNGTPEAMAIAELLPRRYRKDGNP
jgi:cytidine deaminase